MRRLVALLVVALGLAPGTWWRSPVPTEDSRQPVTFTRIAVPAVDLGPLMLAGAWRLRSADAHFGSYSALAVLGDGTLLAGSDRGRTLQFAPPNKPGPPSRFGYFAGRVPAVKTQADVEAFARDPATGLIWASFEVSNRIVRLDPRSGAVAAAAPAAMRGWRAALGAEAMARLADGRFVVLAEGSQSWFGGEMPGLVFPADPVAGAAPVRFRFVPPDGFRPVDMAPLPDGRVVILLRNVEWGVPPSFAAKLMLADPSAIREGKPWRAVAFAELRRPLPTDNYEGLAVEPDGEGGVVLWLISDDNQMALQRTLLLKLVWRPNAKAREPGRALR